MKKVLLPILLAATIFASCSGGDERLKGFENKEFGEYVLKQDKLMNEMITAIETKDSAKMKSLEETQKSLEKDGEKFMTTASEADMKKAEEIIAPTMEKFMKIMFGNMDLNNLTIDTTATDSPVVETTPAPESEGPKK